MEKDRIMFTYVLFASVACSAQIGDLERGMDLNQFPWTRNIITNVPELFIRSGEMKPNIQNRPRLPLHARVIADDIRMFDSTRKKRYEFFERFQFDKKDVVLERIWNKTGSFTNVLTCVISENKIGAMFYSGYTKKCYFAEGHLDNVARCLIRELNEVLHEYEWFPADRLNERYKNLYVILYGDMNACKAYCFSWMSEFMRPHDSSEKSKVKWYIPKNSRNAYLSVRDLLQLIREPILKVVGEGMSDSPNAL